jgi:hypothetical protein
MSRKVYLEIKTKVIMTINDGVDVSEVVNDMNYNFSSEDATIEDTELLDYEVTDSK